MKSPQLQLAFVHTRTEVYIQWDNEKRSSVHHWAMKSEAVVSARCFCSSERFCRFFELFLFLATSLESPNREAKQAAARRDATPRPNFSNLRPRKQEDLKFSMTRTILVTCKP